MQSIFLNFCTMHNDALKNYWVNWMRLMLKMNSIKFVQKSTKLQTAKYTIWYWNRSSFTIPSIWIFPAQRILFLFLFLFVYIIHLLELLRRPYFLCLTPICSYIILGGFEFFLYHFVPVGSNHETNKEK